MQAWARRRSVWVAVALLLAAYVAFVLSTRPSNFGLSLQPDGHTTWTATRLLTFGVWLVRAALPLGIRRAPVAWRSFAASFLTTCVLAAMIAPSLVPASASHAAVAGTIAMYAAVSAFVCITVARPWHAIVLSMLLLPAQLAVDAAGHVLSGQFRLH